MSWAVKYRGEFYDLRGLDWRIDIEEDGYGGAINTMKLGGEPLKISYLTPSDDLLMGNIKGSICQMQVVSETAFQYVGLYATSDMAFRVSIYYGTTNLYWRGYLTADYTEQYNDTPYIVTLTACDGLGLLKDIIFDDTDIFVSYSGYKWFESAFILEILEMIGFTEFKEFCNVYEDRMSNGTGDSPFDQLRIDVNLFEGRYCYEVLQELLQKYNAIIRQISGVFCIYRPTELSDATVYGRHFTAYDTKSPISITPEQLISRSSGVTNIRSYDGGSLTMQQGLKKFIAEQDYGYVESWLNNHNFKANTYNGSPGYTFDGWDTLGGLGSLRPISYWLLGPDESEGCGILYTAGTAPASYYAYQEFGSYGLKTNNSFALEFDYRLINLSGSTKTNVPIYVQIGIGSSYYLYIIDEYTLGWKTSSDYISFNVASVPKGDNTWETFSRAFTGIPDDGPLWIKLFGSDDICIACFKNVRFVCTSDQINVKMTRKRFGEIKWIRNFNTIFIKGDRTPLLRRNVTITDNVEVVEKTYEAINAINGGEKSIQYLLGDVDDTGIVNNIEQFRGSLVFDGLISLTRAAENFVVDFAATYLASDVILTNSGEDLIFTAEVPGTGFSGSTGIFNVTGTLTGSVANTQANQVAQARVDEIELSGSSGAADVTCGEETHVATYDTNLDTTAANFVTDFASNYLAKGIVLTSVDNILVFTAQVPGDDFVGDTTIVNTSGDLSGVVTTTTANQEALAQIDTITLSGGSGTASITCDGITETVTRSTEVAGTESWSTRGGSEADPIIELVADEITSQHARAKHFIQMNIREHGTTAPDVNMMKNFQHSVNQVGGNNRIFVANRGDFDVKNREWVIDLIEII